MCLPEIRLLPFICLLIYSEVAGAASEDNPVVSEPVKTIIEAAQDCFQSANSIPEFWYEESVEVLDGGEGEEIVPPALPTLADTDTEITEPCALAIQNNNLTQRDLAAVYSNQGIVHSSKENYALAIISHTQAIALLENSDEAGFSESIYINRGNSYFAMREYEAANADYSRAILLSAGTQHQALYNRALVFKALGYQRRALEELEHALLLAPNNPRYLASLRLLRKDSPIPEFSQEEPREYLY